MATGINFILPIVLPMVLALVILVFTAIGLLCHYRYKNRNAVEADKRKKKLVVAESTSSGMPALRSDITLLYAFN